ncbi:DUF4198 domain-containing protein [Vibrio sp. RC27]
MLNLFKNKIDKKLVYSLFISALGCLSVWPAQAHFQMLYTPHLLHEKSGTVTLKMPFTHPAISGHVMKVEPLEAFYMLKKGKKTDLLNKVEAIQWQSAVDTGNAFQAQVKLRGLGDYVFILQPSPYFEAEEDVYIQQITKTIVNVGNLPSSWNDDLNLSAEIVPLTKPYALYEGGIFSGVVKSHGKPVPFAAVEVEFINYIPEMDNNRFAATSIMPTSSDAFVAQTIYTDANGTFHFPLLKAGHWGFAALGVGEKTTHKGKPLSQDAVIWVQAEKLPQ